MADKREQILARLVAVAEAVAGINVAVRNDINNSEGKLPAVIVIDGPEEADQGATERNIPGRAANVIHMTPQITVVVKEDTENVGLVLNGFRAAMIKDILSDATLAALAGTGGSGSSGNIRYHGLTPSIDQGRLIIGQISLHFRITYVLKLSDL